MQSNDVAAFPMAFGVARRFARFVRHIDAESIQHVRAQRRAASVHADDKDNAGPVRPTRPPFRQWRRIFNALTAVTRSLARLARMILDVRQFAGPCLISHQFAASEAALLGRRIVRKSACIALSVCVYNA